MQEMRGKKNREKGATANHRRWDDVRFFVDFIIITSNGMGDFAISITNDDAATTAKNVDGNAEGHESFFVFPFLFSPVEDFA